jgi:hypothetical protein
VGCGAENGSKSRHNVGLYDAELIMTTKDFSISHLYFTGHQPMGSFPSATCSVCYCHWVAEVLHMLRSIGTLPLRIGNFVFEEIVDKKNTTT